MDNLHNIQQIMDKPTLQQFKKACSVNDTKIIQYYVENKLFITSYNDVFSTAYEKNNKKTIQYFLSNDLVDIPNEIFKKAYTDDDNAEVVKYCVEKCYFGKDNVNAFYTACMNGNFKVVEYFMSNKLMDGFWKGAFYYAAMYEHIDIIKLFAECGWNGWNDGLLATVFWGRIDAAKFLIEKGANNFDQVLDKIKIRSNPYAETDFEEYDQMIKKCKQIKLILLH